MNHDLGRTKRSYWKSLLTLILYFPDVACTPGPDRHHAPNGKPRRVRNSAGVPAALLSCLLIVGCGKSTINWKEDVQLLSGEVIVVKRTAKTQSIGGIGGPDGWENEGMTVEIIQPVKPDNPAIWSGKFQPLVFDRDRDTQEWFIVATFATCSGWYELGRPKLPYTEFRYRNGRWIQQALSEKYIGRESNMLVTIRSSGVPDQTIDSKRGSRGDPRIAPEYVRIVGKWETNC